jgi:DNA-binding transcriptional LysR family regulator
MLTQSRLFKHFDAIRRAGSIREAARQLHISSSALNRQLLMLESGFGFSLFDRLPQGLRLTPGGEIVARHATTVLQDEQRMHSELDALKGVRRGTVAIATTESLTSTFIPTVVERMVERHPLVKLSVRISGSAEAAAAVIQGHADIAIAFVGDRAEHLRQLAVGKFRLGAALAKGHALAGRRSLTLAECARHPLVLPTPELGMFNDLQPLLKSHKRARNVILETGSFELMRGLATRGIGIAFVHQFGIERECAQGLLRHVPLKGAELAYLGVYVRAERTLPAALDAFARLTADEIRRREAQER